MGGPIDPQSAVFSSSSSSSSSSTAAAANQQQKASPASLSHPCFPLYLEVLKSVKREDFKPRGLIVNEEAQAKLGEFYLCCAYTLNPEEVESAKGDKEKLLKLARKTAEEEIEPWIAAVRSFTEDYDPVLAAKLEEAAKFKACNELLFWRLNFEASAPSLFAAFLERAEQQKDRSNEIQTENPEVPEALKPLADSVYSEWLAAAAQPLKGELQQLLSRWGLLVANEEPSGKTQQDEPS